MAWANIDDRRKRVKEMLDAGRPDKEIVKECSIEFHCSHCAIYADLHTFRGTGYTRKKNRDKVALRDKYTCQYCGIESKYGVSEHVISRSMGGHDKHYNIVYACYSCNVRKRLKVWVPANLDIITINHPKWRAKIISMATVMRTKNK